MAYELLRREKNAIFDIVTAYGFDPTDFRWDVVRGPDVGLLAGDWPRLSFGNGEFYLCLSNHGSRGWQVTYSPGSDSRHSRSPMVSWEGVLHECEAWASYLRDEAGLVDKWAGVTQQARRLLESPDADINRPFTPLERQELSDRLDALVREVGRTQRLSIIQTRLLLAAVEEAKQASGRLGKKDWILLFGGLLLQLGAAAALEPVVARAIGQLATATVSWVLGQPVLPP